MGLRALLDRLGDRQVPTGPEYRELTDTQRDIVIRPATYDEVEVIGWSHGVLLPKVQRVEIVGEVVAYIRDTPDAAYRLIDAIRERYPR